MSDATRILDAIEWGDAKATDELLLLGAQRLSQEPPGQILQATALVHEAYFRLVGAEAQRWESPRHFFSAALRPAPKFSRKMRILLDRDFGMR